MPAAHAVVAEARPRTALLFLARRTGFKVIGAGLISESVPFPREVPAVFRGANKNIEGEKAC